MSIVLKISKGLIYYYAFPTEMELNLVSIKFDEILDSGFTLKSLTEEEYEKEIDVFNDIERSDFDSQILEKKCFELSIEFIKLFGI